MKERLIKKLSEISDYEYTVLSENYNPFSNAKPAFGNMKLIRNDSVWNVIKGLTTVSAKPHTRFVDIPLHSHNYIEMMYVLSGQVIHHIEGKAITVSKGSILLMNRHVQHSISASGKNDIAVNMLISGDWLSTTTASRLRNSAFLRDLTDENKSDSGESRFLIYNVEGEEYIEHLLQDLIHQLLFEDSIAESILTDTLLLIFRHLEAKPHTIIFSSSGEKDGDPIRQKIGAYIQNSYKTASLEELAGILNMTSPYVSRRIKEIFGAPFTELIREKRFSEAELLLLQSDIPVTEIAEAVGYENNSFFHRRFKERYGISPGKWRRMTKNR